MSSFLNLSHHHSLVSATSIAGRNVGQAIPTDIEDNEDLALETFINSLQLPEFFQLDEDEQAERLSKIDVLELFRALQNFNRELAMVRLENYVLTDFLEKNDPKLLIGLEQRRATAMAQINLRKASGPSLGVSTGSVGAFRSKSIVSKSLLSSYTPSSQKKIATAYEYKLNYRSKADMAEKMASEVQKRVNELEKNGMLRHKKLLTIKL